MAQVYIKNNLFPALKERDRWTDIFIGNLTFPFNRIEKELIQGNKKVLEEIDVIDKDYYLNRPKNIISEVNKNFLCRGIFPNSQLFDNCLKLIMVLEVATDGIIFKLKRTNETVTKQKALSQINMEYNSYTLTGVPVDFIKKEELPNRIQLVNGEIEIVEIKAGKSYIPEHQRKNYREAIKNGFFLRYFHVDIISFNDNHFEIKERLITNPEEVTRFPLGSP